MDLLTIVILFVSFCLITFCFLKLSGNSSSIEEPLYTQRDALFTPAERSFYGVLEQAISNEYKVFGKVRVADILKPNSSLNKSEWQTAFNKISSKHFDYVLCQKDTLEVVGVVELDDKSHNSKKAKNRDAFLEAACNGANLKLIRFICQRTYQTDSVRLNIMGSIDELQPCLLTE
jgi:very-short-patch-repair endonuclease